MTSVVVHSFGERLDYSNRMSDEPSWTDFYRRVWPNVHHLIRVEGDCEHQRNGIDRIVILKDGREFRVDEKKRERSKKTLKVYDDFLMEAYGDLAKKKLGWSVDPTKRCDFITYAIAEIFKCYLLPYELLRMTCRANWQEWTKGHPLDAQNNGWVTRNYAIPWQVLFAAMEAQMKRAFGSGEKLELPVVQVVGEQAVFQWGEPA